MRSEDKQHAGSRNCIWRGEQEILKVTMQYVCVVAEEERGESTGRNQQALWGKEQNVKKYYVLRSIESC